MLTTVFKNHNEAVAYFKLHKKLLMDYELQKSRVPSCFTDDHIDKLGYPRFSLFDSTFDVKYLPLTDSFKTSLYNYCTCSIDDYVDLIRNDPDNLTRIYEVYTNETKLFMDIDKVDYNNPELIKTIIDDFIKFIKSKCNIDINEYIVTKNNASHHKNVSLSYHVIFPEYAGTLYTIQCYIKNFINNYHDYYGFIDGVVYNPRRLFRAVNQCSAAIKELDPDDRHLFHMYYKDGEIKYDNEIIETDELLKGTVLQYIKDCEYLNEISNPKHIKLSNTSYIPNIVNTRLSYYRYSSSVYSNLLKTVCGVTINNDINEIMSLSDQEFRKYLVNNVYRITPKQLRSIRNALQGKLKHDDKYDKEAIKSDICEDEEFDW